MRPVEQALSAAVEALKAAISLLGETKPAPRRVYPSHTDFWEERLKHVSRMLITSAGGLVLATVTFEGPPERCPAGSNTLICRPKQNTPILYTGRAVSAVFVDSGGVELLRQPVSDEWGSLGVVLRSANLHAGAALTWDAPFRFTSEVP